MVRFVIFLLGMHGTMLNNKKHRTPPFREPKILCWLASCGKRMKCRSSIRLPSISLMLLCEPWLSNGLEEDKQGKSPPPLLLIHAWLWLLSPILRFSALARVVTVGSLLRSTLCRAHKSGCVEHGFDLLYASRTLRQSKQFVAHILNIGSQSPSPHNHKA